MPKFKVGDRVMFTNHPATTPPYRGHQGIVVGVDKEEVLVEYKKLGYEGTSVTQGKFNRFRKMTKLEHILK